MSYAFAGARERYRGDGDAARAEERCMLRANRHILCMLTASHIRFVCRAALRYAFDASGDMLRHVACERRYDASAGADYIADAAPPIHTAARL